MSALDGYDEIEYDDGAAPDLIRVKFSQKRISVEEVSMLQDSSDRERVYELVARFTLADDGNYATRCIVNRLGERRFPGIEAQIARLKRADIGTFNAAVNSMVAGLKDVRREAVPLSKEEALSEP